VKPTVFVPEPIAECGMTMLREGCDCIAPWADGRKLIDSELRDILYGADAIIVRLFKIDASDLDRSPDLKVIGKHGVGVDNIDCRAATERGIPVVYTPTANANAVAEHTIALMLALARNTVPASAALREGRFADRPQFKGVELAGRTLGVVGLGRVGSRVAEIAAAGLAMAVCGYDPFLSAGTSTGPAELTSSPEELFARADFLTLHVALTPETRHLIDDKRIGMLKPGCRIINTSRGAVIDEDALIRALERSVPSRAVGLPVRRLTSSRKSPFPPTTLSAGHRTC